MYAVVCMPLLPFTEHRCLMTNLLYGHNLSSEPFPLYVINLAQLRGSHMNKDYHGQRSDRGMRSWGSPLSPHWLDLLPWCQSVMNTCKILTCHWITESWGVRSTSVVWSGHPVTASTQHLTAGAVLGDAGTHDEFWCVRGKTRSPPETFSHKTNTAA